VPLNQLLKNIISQSNKIRKKELHIKFNIPEHNLDPSIEHVVGRCYYCGEEVYQGDGIWIDYEENIIHNDCRDEDSKRFYMRHGEAEEIQIEIECEKRNIY
jgi:hypothetical protein